MQANSSAPTPERPRPEPRINVDVKGPKDENVQHRELFMSAGLRSNLVAIASAADDFTRILTDPILQELLIVEVLAPRTPRGSADTHKYSLTDFEMSPEDADRIIDWVEAHVVDFFVKAVAKVEASALKETGAMKTLTDSLTGLANSAGLKPSAGPSTAE